MCEEGGEDGGMYRIGKPNKTKKGMKKQIDKSMFKFVRALKVAYGVPVEEGYKIWKTEEKDPRKLNLRKLRSYKEYKKLPKRKYYYSPLRKDPKKNPWILFYKKFPYEPFISVYNEEYKTEEPLTHKTYKIGDHAALISKAYKAIIDKYANPDIKIPVLTPELTGDIILELVKKEHEIIVNRLQGKNMGKID